MSRSRSYLNLDIFDNIIVQQLMISFCMDLDDLHTLLWILKSC